jgi:hypothetical protein
LVGLARFTVETDAKYIKGMLNNPDIQPNAAVNRWIAAVLLFDFDLVHVPGTKHMVADGLSRRQPMEEDPQEEDDFEDWIDKVHGFAMEVLNWHGNMGYVKSIVSGGHSGAMSSVSGRALALSITVSGTALGHPKRIHSPRAYVYSLTESPDRIPWSKDAEKRDEELKAVEEFLSDPARRKGMSGAHSVTLPI